MIIGIGTDIINISRIEAMLERRGNRFAQKILGPNEYQRFLETKNKTTYLAKRFAAKEAASKALGTGFRDGLWFTHIEVENDEMGKPRLVFNRRGAEMEASLGIKSTHLSVTDEKDYAVAFVVLEA